VCLGLGCCQAVLLEVMLKVMSGRCDHADGETGWCFRV
jgi:hypothetical protein